MYKFKVMEQDKRDRFEELKTQRKRLRQRKIFFPHEEEYNQLRTEAYYDISTLPEGFRGLEDFKSNPAYLYAYNVVNGTFDIPDEFNVDPDNIVNDYVYIVAKEFLEDMERAETDEEYEYIFDFRYASQVYKKTGLMIMPAGVAAGKPVNQVLAGFQWFFIMCSMGWKQRKDINKRRYEKNLLLIARKSGKTFLTAVMLLLLLLLEPKYSQFYSVAPDLELSSLILNEMKNIIDASPVLSKHMNSPKDRIEYDIKKSKFQPLATSNNRMDGEICRHSLVINY